jgi:ribosomal protein S18 acetylase RimI-like enzyme
MAADFTIRPYRPRRDTPAILRLIRRELAPLSRKPIGREALTDRALAERIRRGRTLVAVGRGGKVKGFVHILVVEQPDAPARLMVDLLAVEPASRGRGIGSALLREAEAYGRRIKCQAASLFVDEGNDLAHRFYLHAGYHTVRYWPQLRCWELHKPLSPPDDFPPGAKWSAWSEPTAAFHAIVLRRKLSR